MALSDVRASREQLKEYREVLARRQAELEAELGDASASVSEERHEVSGEADFGYVVVGGRFVRIVSCEASGPELAIPAELGGLPVRSIGKDSCSGLERVERISCPDDIIEIGGGAFRNCPALAEIVLPARLAAFDKTWLKGCASLRSLTLSGMLEAVPSEVFDGPAIERLSLGEGTVRVEPGAFSKSKLQSVAVDEGNAFLLTDGRAVFSRDGSVLLALAVPTAEYDVPEGCTRIAEKAFASRGELVRVGLPGTLREIGDRAFAQTGITSFAAPSGLESIGAHAFFRCLQLREVLLNDGLREIGANAFSATKVSALEVPSSVTELGDDFISNAAVQFTGPGQGLSFTGESLMSIDPDGGLYRRTDDGLRFMRLMDPAAERYEVLPGTVEVAPRAFIRHANIVSVTLPEGVRTIGASAFSGCAALRRVEIPDTLESIGEEAFYDSSIESLRIPAGMTELGVRALATRGAAHGNIVPSLSEIEVDAGNPRFWIEEGLLCERLDDGATKVVIYLGRKESVTIPANTRTIGTFAFSGAVGLRSLSISNAVRHVEHGAFNIGATINHLHIDLVKPIGGHTSFDLDFPDTMRSRHELQLAFGLTQRIDVERILSHYDGAVMFLNDYGRGVDKGGRSIEDQYRQAISIIGRLKDPVLMSELNRSLFDKAISKNIANICLVLARYDDRAAVDDLLDLGYLNEDNLLKVIEKVGTLKDAAMTGHLLEEKRRRFGGRAIDFDL